MGVQKIPTADCRSEADDERSYCILLCLGERGGTMLHVSNAKHRPAGYQRAKVLDSELLFIESLRKSAGGGGAQDAFRIDILRVGAGIRPAQPANPKRSCHCERGESGQAESAMLRFMKLLKKPRSRKITGTCSPTPSVVQINLQVHGNRI